MICLYCGRPMVEVARWEVLDLVWLACDDCCLILPDMATPIEDDEPLPEVA
jgi:hypothetical protein